MQAGIFPSGEPHGEGTEASSGLCSMSFDLLTLIAIFMIGNFGGFLIGRQTRERDYSKGWDKGNRSGIEFLVKLESGIWEREIQQKQLRIAMENWP